MEQRFLDYMTAYKKDVAFLESETEEWDISGVHILVKLWESERDHERRDWAQIRMVRDGLHYECEGIERNRWDFFPVTVEGRAYILFSKTLYGFTLIDPDTLTEAYDYFPEKVYDGDESFIITDAKTFGRYLIFTGCYWGSPYFFVAFDHELEVFADLSHHYGVQDGECRIEGDRLILSGLDLDMERAEACATEKDIDTLILLYGVDTLS